MLSMSIIAFINVWLLLAPPIPLISLLELMRIPISARFTLLLAILLNILLSVIFEHWAADVIAESIGLVTRFVRSRRRIRDGKMYKAVENGMR